MKNITFQDIFDTPSVQQGTLNGEAQTPDGNVYVYLYATEAITKYDITERPAITDVDTLSSAASPLDSAKYIYITEASAGWTAGAYQDHWLVVDDGTGEGQGGKIKDNTADTLELYFQHALTTALAVADSDITIVHWPDAEQLDVSATLASVNGIAQMAFASADYGYFLKRGIGLVTIGDTAGVLNQLLIPGSDALGGALGIASGATSDDTAIIGKCLVANTTADKATLIEANIGGL